MGLISKRGEEDDGQIIMTDDLILHHLKDLHALFYSPAKPNFGIKQRFLKEMLKKADIPFIDFEDEKLHCPSLLVLREEVPSSPKSAAIMEKAKLRRTLEMAPLDALSIRLSLYAIGRNQLSEETS